MVEKENLLLRWWGRGSGQPRRRTHPRLVRRKTREETEGAVGIGSRKTGTVIICAGDKAG